MSRDPEVRRLPRQPDCFLCEPSQDLVYKTSDHGNAISGLGPIVPFYSVVGAKPHIRSAADMVAEGDLEFLEFAQKMRGHLEKKLGSCLLTEHGRMPVCADVMAAERHCYHAHFLLFPQAPSIIDAVKTYFDEVQPAQSLRDALKIASSKREYFLFSPSNEEFLVCSEHRDIPRQFARRLVAIALGRPDDAAWSLRPGEDRAKGYALELRTDLGGI